MEHTSNESGDPFYENAKKYWSEIPPTVDGMLGGFSHISSTDIAGSMKFLRRFILPKGKSSNDGCSTTTGTGNHRALDCGAGIGRITKRLLLPSFDTVDMVELNEDFLNQAKVHLDKDASRVEKYICSGLQDFIPETGRYDVIWIQWVLGHLTDEDFVKFFKRCQLGLAKNGLIVVKENILCDSGRVDFDEQDSSYTRPKDKVLDLLNSAGLNLLYQEKQKNFPKDIYSVWMFALQ